MLDYGEVEEAELAYTGVWVNGPGAVALDWGRVVSVCSQWGQDWEMLSLGLDRLFECACGTA